MSRLIDCVLSAAVLAVQTACCESVGGDLGESEGCDPAAVAHRVSRQLLRTRPECYCPPGYRGNGYADKGYGGGKFVQYAIVSLWANGLECARLSGDVGTETALIRLYDDFLPGGTKHGLCSRPYHVDDSIFGSVALQIFIQTGDRRYLAEGLKYADAQWTAPCAQTIRERHAASPEEQDAYWRDGYTPQTRLWIDDMYMITLLQSQAYRATGDRKYIDRAAREMCLYLDRLQLKTGRAKGLFYHAPDVPFVWGRGDGWMAAGMALILKHLPADSEYRPRILEGYRMMMEALLHYQRADGMWCQLVDEPAADGNWPESSCTAMFASALIAGTGNGWLAGPEYASAAKKAWTALCRRLDENGNVPDVCCGTGKKNDRQYYFDRIRVHGDPHGQAPMLWCAEELLERKASAALDLRPTFVGCGVEFAAPQPLEDIRLDCRRAGGDWTAVERFEFPYFADTKSYRGSIRNLTEGIDYEVRVVGADGILAHGSFRTWQSDIPVARTVELSADGTLPIIIAEKGTPDGWIQYVARDGRTLDFGERADVPVVIDGAEYVIVEGLRILGNRARYVIDVKDSHFVRIVNCDISRWGRTGLPRFDIQGQLFDPEVEAERYGINFDGAIRVGKGAFGCVVERCWIHDPRGRANSWFYSHPAGPEAILMDKPDGSTVIRWNDFTGSDIHRFNDAVEGMWNFDRDGGFNRDADIYGNFMAFCNDDCIELDGGQRNVRCFGNRFESALCGVSVQGCMMGPCYVYGNLFSGMGEEFGASGQTIKTGSGPHGKGAVVFADENVLWGAGSGILMMTNLHAVVRGNVFCGRQSIGKPERSPDSVFSGNDMGAEIAEARLCDGFPRRPTPYTVDRARFSGIRVDGGAATPAQVEVVVRGGLGGTFSVVKCDGMDWFDVSPSSGCVAPGAEARLSIAFRPEKMNDRRHYRGCFLVRSPEGFSCPVTIYAQTDFIPPYRAGRAGDVAIYHSAFSEGTWTPLCNGDGPGAFAFDVPQDGRYYFMVRAKGRLSVKASVDDEAPEVSRQQNEPYPTWTMLTPARGFGNMCRHYDLKAGRHVLRIWRNEGRPLAEGLVLTDNPQSFEPR